MAKKEGSNHIDFDNLRDEDSRKIFQAVKIIAEYEAEKKAANESKRQTIEDLIVDLDADKPSTKALKKYLTKLVKTYMNKDAEKIREEHGHIERMLVKMGELTPDDQE